MEQRGTEGSPQFPHAKKCPKKCQKGDITHTRMWAHKITISNLNSSKYTCLNSLIVFYSAEAHICHFRNRLIKPSCLQVSLHPFHATETGFYSGRCWEITLLLFERVHTWISIQRWRGTVGTVNTASLFGVLLPSDWVTESTPWELNYQTQTMTNK